MPYSENRDERLAGKTFAVGEYTQQDIENRNSAIFNSVMQGFVAKVNELVEEGISDEQINKLLNAENSRVRDEVILPWNRLLNQFHANGADKKGLIDRITEHKRSEEIKQLEPDELNRAFNKYKERIERMVDDANVVFKELAFRRGSGQGIAGVHSWRELEQSIAAHRGNTGFSIREPRVKGAEYYARGSNNPIGRDGRDAGTVAGGNTNGGGMDGGARATEGNGGARQENSVKANESRSEHQGGFSDGQIFKQAAWHGWDENIDNPGGNGDNSRGSDIVDERTAREIEREKPAVRRQYEGTPGWMKAPNGKDTNLTEEQWLAARTKAFRRKYGHWDYDGSERVGGVDISYSNLAKKDGTPINLNNTHDVEEWVRQNIQGASVTVNRDGTVVGFSRRGLSDGVSKARDRGIGRDKNNRLLFAKLQEIIQKSAYFDFREADEKHNRRHVLGQDIYQAYMKAGNSHYRVELMLDVKPDQAVTYKGHQAYKIKIEPAVYHTQAENSGAYARTSSNFTISLDDLMEGVKPKEPKIPLDENGEPIFSDIPGKPDTERKPAPEREKQNTTQAQSRSDHQGGFFDGQFAASKKPTS